MVWLRIVSEPTAAKDYTRRMKLRMHLRYACNEYFLSDNATHGRMGGTKELPDFKVWHHSTGATPNDRFANEITWSMVRVDWIQML